ncbi:MAG: immune inhibitor A [Chloroflexi bacterium]|nr:immune inhibitor A [Chloroflexota bacterium]
MDYHLKICVWLFALVSVSMACSSSAATRAPTSQPTAPATPIPPSQPAATSTPSFVLSNPDSALVDTTTLDTLTNTNVPIRDLLDVARRLLGIDDIPRALPLVTSFQQVGDRMEFWVTNNDTAEKRQVSAVLQYVTEHAYFWIEDSVSFDREDVRALTETFENEIYSTNRAFFGSEWTPGVDGDPHVYILVARNIGTGVAGYFSSADGFLPGVLPGANGHEMFVLNGDNLNLGSPFAYSVLAHEYQHVIHWNLDRNETSFINEGFSVVAQMLNGYAIGPDPQTYLADPDIQLNDWPYLASSRPNYGASFLFLAYILDRFGDAVTQALAAHPANGLASIDMVMAELGVDGNISGQSLTADDIVMDWALANFLNEPSLVDGRYAYNQYSISTDIFPTERVVDCDSNPQFRDVHQYGIDYIQFDCAGQHTLQFEGDVQTSLLPSGAHSGEFAFWSNKGHQSDMTLTRTFDFSAESGPLTFNYWTWYDIESDWDYVYLLASTDGENWEFLITPAGTDSNPSGNNYGWGLTDRSGGTGKWIHESVDISQYAGQVVQLRFEYITDTAINGEGMLIDDISVPEVDYFTDFETDAGGWKAEGFARVTNTLPQTFRIGLISFGDTIVVEYITLDAFNRAEILLDFDQFDYYILVVVGSTRFTRQLANYSFSFAP